MVYDVEDQATTRPTSPAPAARSSVPHLDPLVARYDRPLLFFGLATGVPWVTWTIAGLLSRRPDPPMPLVAALGMTGLLAPIVVALGLAARDRVVWHDLLHRIVNARDVPRLFWLVAMLLLPGALMLGTGVSVLLGYSPDQFHLRGGMSFTSGMLPAWFIVGFAPVVEELAWHGYGTDSLSSRWSVWRTSLVFTRPVVEDGAA